jgi:hypothetical protein
MKKSSFSYISQAIRVGIFDKKDLQTFDLGTNLEIQHYLSAYVLSQLRLVFNE